jgi:hypothetical protein
MSFSLVTMETKMTFLPFFNDKNYQKSLIQGFIFFLFVKQKCFVHLNVSILYGNKLN